MNLSEEHIELLKGILQEMCTGSEPIPRSKIFAAFASKAQVGVEKYLFERDLSELVKNNIIPGYQIKVGRKGGVSKKETMEQVTVTCSSGNYIGQVPKTQLTEFISSFNYERWSHQKE
jgi:hypothetical protein